MDWIPYACGAIVLFVAVACIPFGRYDLSLLDEIAVSIAPVLLTGGAPLLPRRLDSDRLRLVSAKAVGQFARLVYTVGPRG